MAKYEKIRTEMKKKRNMYFVELRRTCLNQGRMQGGARGAVTLLSDQGAFTLFKS